MISCDPSHYVNRELSWLEFNQRVLDQATDAQNPLLERLKFLCIVSSNLDEFFEVRVAGLKQQRAHGSHTAGPDGMLPGKALAKISERARKMVSDQYRCWTEELQPALAKEGIRFHQFPKVPKGELAHFDKFFRETVYPVLTPLALDAAHPFPQLLNKGFNVLVEMESNDANTDLVVVRVPRSLPRVVPFFKREEGEDFVFLGGLVRHYAHTLVNNAKVKGAYLFRVTRNSNLYYDEEEAHNLLNTIEEELRNVNRGAAVRVEVEEECPDHLVDRLKDLFVLEDEDVYRCPHPLNLLRLMPLCFQINRPDLRDKSFTPHTVVPSDAMADIFHLIRKGDILMHHPYDSFQTVVDFLSNAAQDPNVLAIKQTLYRTSADSPLVHALIEAANNGKQVTVVIELKARFDEAANIRWARLMQEAGVDVVYGVTGLKTHAKAMLIVRKEGDVTRRYAHLGTGNYHPKTAAIYTDLGLLTAREDITSDLAEVFNLITGIPNFVGMQTLLVAPFNMVNRFVEMIDREAENAKAGKPSGIYAKVNALVEENVIEALYRASQAGVPIRLMVRGMCALRPGMPGVSETIEVRSLVGRFLEHSRIYRFENGGEPEIYLGSADWMQRNLHRRVETVFPIKSNGMREHISGILETFWKDNVKARVMLTDGTYVKLESGEAPFDAQQSFVEEAERHRKHRTASLSNL